MNEWFAFVIALGSGFVEWLSTATLFGVSLGGILAGFFLLGVIFRIFYKV